MHQTRLNEDRSLIQIETAVCVHWKKTEFNGEIFWLTDVLKYSSNLMILAFTTMFSQT